MSRRDHRHSPGWGPFERFPDRYDAWFDSERGRRIFGVEVACIENLLVGMPRPWLEVGAGTGRFAAALRIDEGIDPSGAVLRYAVDRGVNVRLAEAEHLPYASNQFGVFFLIVTICFLKDAVPALAECRRVLRTGGYLIIGLVPRNSPWGTTYARQGREGHPFYTAAEFYTAEEIIRIAEAVGFRYERSRSCLFEDPGLDVERYQPPREGIVPGAGFVTMRLKAEAVSIPTRPRRC